MDITKSLRLKIVGAGSVGMSIIQAFAQQGFDVMGIEIDEKVIQRGSARVEKNLEKLVERNKITAEEKAAVLNRIHLTADFEALKDAEVVIEAVFEDMEVKKTSFFICNAIL